jgi:hypothetical protein
LKQQEADACYKPDLFRLNVERLRRTHDGFLPVSLPEQQPPEQPAPYSKGIEAEPQRLYRWRKGKFGGVNEKSLE